MREHCERCAQRALSFTAGDPHPFALPGATAHYAADRPVRAEHLKLQLQLDFEKAEVSGTCSTKVRAVREVSTLTFDAVDLEVEWVTVDDERVEFTNSGRHLRAELGRPLPE